MKLFIILIVAALSTACAKPNTAPMEPAPMIPMVLINIEKNTIVAIPDQPSTKKLVSIRKDDRADEALATTLDYTKALKTYATAVTGIATECTAELNDRDERLRKIKQYILLNQPRMQSH